VDRLVDKFLAEVNWCLDAVHERTFRNQYNEFWARRFGFDDLAGVDLRWLALLFIILAFSGLIDAPPNCTKEMQRDCEETSLRFYVGSPFQVVRPIFADSSICSGHHGERSLSLLRSMASRPTLSGQDFLSLAIFCTRDGSPNPG
jgi:hypothetical protein